MVVFMDRYVISHRHQILVLALLQCLLISSFSVKISATKFQVDRLSELHRSMARYRQLRVFVNSERDLIEADEKTMKENGEADVNLTNIDQQQQEGLEKMGDEVESPTEENSNENPHLNQQRQGGAEKHVERESKKVDELENHTAENSELVHQKNHDLENDHFERSSVNNSNEILELNQTTVEHQSKKVDQVERPINDENPNVNPELDQQQRKGLEKDIEHVPKTKEQQQGEGKRGPPIGENKTEKEESFVFPEPYLLGPTIKDWDEQRGSWLETNPQMKSPLHKPRVLLVSGSQPGPCVSPVGDYFHIKSLKLKIDYARMHGYEFYYNFAWLDPLFGGWWVKLPTLRKLMLTHPEIEWFFWVDSDALFTDMLFKAPFHTFEGYNMVMWGWEDGLLNKRSWVAFNAGVFLIRNCQWSLDLIDKWSPMGPRGPVRDEWGKILTSFLSFRKDNFSSDDQSALAYLMITDEAVRSKVKLVDSDTYAMSGFWIEVVDTYEDCAKRYHPGLGDKRWPWITHFTGCGYCAGGDNPDYSYERCMDTFERAYNFADNQVLAFMGFQHDSHSSPNVTRIRNETGQLLEFVGVNPWEERIAQLAAEAQGKTSG